METRSLCDLADGLVGHSIGLVVDGTSCVGFSPVRFVFDGRDVSDGFEKPAGVPPVHPAEGGQLHVLDGPPGSSSGDQLGLVKADDRFGHGVVIGVSFRPDRGDGTFLSESLGVSDGEVLHSSVGVVDQTFETLCLAGPNRLFQGVESQIGSEGVGDPPADDPSREDVDDERRVGEAGPGGSHR